VWHPHLTPGYHAPRPKPLIRKCPFGFSSGPGIRQIQFPHYPHRQVAGQVLAFTISVFSLLSSVWTFLTPYRVAHDIANCPGKLGRE